MRAHILSLTPAFELPFLPKHTKTQPAAHPLFWFFFTRGGGYQLKQSPAKVSLGLDNVPPGLVAGKLRLFRTCQGSMFEQLAPLTVAHHDTSGEVTLDLNHSCVYTLTSSPDLGAAIPTSDIPPTKSFPTE